MVNCGAGLAFHNFAGLVKLGYHLSGIAAQDMVLEDVVSVKSLSAFVAFIRSKKERKRVNLLFQIRFSKLNRNPIIRQYDKLSYSHEIRDFADAVQLVLT